MNKKLNLLFIIITFFLFINVNAERKVCDNEVHYYYFLSFPENSYECYKIENNLKVQVACTDGVYKNSKVNLDDNLKNRDQITTDIVFDKFEIPDDYKIKSVQINPQTEFSKDTYYMIFDALINQNTLKEVDNYKEVDTNYIYKQNKGKTVVYHHFASNLDNDFIKTKEYFNNLSKEEQINYREKIVTDMSLANISNSATIGIGDTENFTPLTDQNLNEIFNKVTIQRILKSNNSNPFYYYVDQGGTMMNLTYITLAQVEVVLETSCRNQTCEEISQEYLGCINSQTCSADLQDEYEICNPLEQVKNPRTTDLNVKLVIVIIISMICLIYVTYKKENN